MCNLVRKGLTIKSVRNYVKNLKKVLWIERALLLLSRLAPSVSPQPVAVAVAVPVTRTGYLNNYNAIPSPPQTSPNYSLNSSTNK